MSEPISVVLADDHQILVDALRRLIDATGEMRVVATANDADTAVTAVLEHKPAVIVLDISMPGGGLEVIRRMAEFGSTTKVVVLTMYGEERYVLEAVRLGARGYVLKRSADRDLLEAIRTVAHGNGYLTPAAVRVLLANERGDRPEPALSPREREVLRLTVRGHSNKEIGEKLFVSPKTVDTYRARVMAKLDVHRRSELVAYALEHGLLD
ncbi:MAG TPA: response regulator transcription factor [Candidatus Limnocylindria bacterium]|nr:response regulator transcription factor [Candidatus Limnocylindria bacterium]